MLVHIRTLWDAHMGAAVDVDVGGGGSAAQGFGGSGSGHGSTHAHTHTRAKAASAYGCVPLPMMTQESVRAGDGDGADRVQLSTIARNITARCVWVCRSVGRWVGGCACASFRSRLL